MSSESGETGYDPKNIDLLDGLASTRRRPGLHWDVRFMEFLEEAFRGGETSRGAYDLRGEPRFVELKTRWCAKEISLSQAVSEFCEPQGK